MKFKILFFLCIYSLLFSQNKEIRFAYEYQFAQDSTKIDSTFSELMYLDISKEGSRFYSRDVFVGDSLMNNAIRQQKSSGKVYFDKNKGKQRMTIKKFYPDFIITETTNIGFDRYEYQDKRKMNWQITNELKTIEGFDVQKATIKAFGRKWTAWFSVAYPFQDGPYKFHGLPGIIVEIEDAKKGHIFTLKGIKNLKPEEVWPLETPKRYAKNLIILDREKYKKVFQTYRNDPMKDWKPTMGGAIQFQASYNGKPMSAKEVEKMTKERLKKENNILELDLLK